ncbi:hypothetical protein DL98DRAFT_597880 [Cadophora sp. DSE1049]|nr:hypothetical protein DL98DRAFT_597880 [Cadophora sp. DSE1049]
MLQDGGTVYDGSENDNDDDARDLPTIEELLFTKLQKEGFTAADPNPGHRERGAEEEATDEKGGAIDYYGSALGDNSSRSLEDLIVLQGDSDSSASKAEVNENTLRVESAAVPGAGLFDSPGTAFDLITPAPPCSSDGWHDIDDFPEKAPHLPLAEQGASTSNSTHPYTPSSRLSSEPLHDSISIEGSRHARFEATTPSSSPPPRYCRASLETQLSQEGRLHTGRGVADEHGLAGPARNADPVNERERRQQLQQGVEQEEDEDNDKDTSSKSEHPPSLQGASVRKCRPLREDSVILGMETIEPPQADVDLLDWEAGSMAPMQLKVWLRASADRDTKTLVDDQPEGLQQEVKSVAAEPTAKRVGDTYLSGTADGSPRPAKRRQLLPDREPSLATSYDEAGCDSHSGGELNNTESNEDDEESRPMKRKRSSSS